MEEKTPLESLKGKSRVATAVAAKASVAAKKSKKAVARRKDNAKISAAVAKKLMNASLDELSEICGFPITDDDSDVLKDVGAIMDGGVGVIGESVPIVRGARALTKFRKLVELGNVVKAVEVQNAAMMVASKIAKSLGSITKEDLEGVNLKTRVDAMAKLIDVGRGGGAGTSNAGAGAAGQLNVLIQNNTGDRRQQEEAIIRFMSERGEVVTALGENEE